MSKCKMFHDVGCKQCDEPLIIPNWFDRENLEDIICEEINPEQFRKFKQFVQDTGLADTVSQLIRETWFDFTA